MLTNNPDKVCYGPKSVDFVIEHCAAEVLLIVDTLFRSKTVALRKKYVRLVELAEKNGIKVAMFNSSSPAGLRIHGLTGVAAILRYPIPELDDIDEDYKSESEESDHQEEETKS